MAQRLLRRHVIGGLIAALGGVVSAGRSVGANSDTSGSAGALTDGAENGDIGVTVYEYPENQPLSVSTVCYDANGWHIPYSQTVTTYELDSLGRVTRVRSRDV